MDNESKIVVYFAHLASEQSVINRALYDAIRDLPQVNFHDLHELYRHYHEGFDVRIRISVDVRERLRETMQSDVDHILTQADPEWRQPATDKPDTQ